MGAHSEGGARDLSVQRASATVVESAFGSEGISRQRGKDSSPRSRLPKTIFKRFSRHKESLEPSEPLGPHTQRMVEALGYSSDMDQSQMDRLGFSRVDLGSATHTISRDKQLPDVEDWKAARRTLQVDSRDTYVVSGSLVLAADGTVDLLTSGKHPDRIHLGEVASETSTALRDVQGFEVAMIIGDVQNTGLNNYTGSVHAEVLTAPKNPDLKLVPDGAVVGLEGFVQDSEGEDGVHLRISRGAKEKKVIVRPLTMQDRTPITGGELLTQDKVRVSVVVNEKGEFLEQAGSFYTVSVVESRQERDKKIREDVGSNLAQISTLLRIDPVLGRFPSDEAYAEARQLYARTRLLPLSSKEEDLLEHRLKMFEVPQTDYVDGREIVTYDRSQEPARWLMQDNREGANRGDLRTATDTRTISYAEVDAYNEVAQGKDVENHLLESATFVQAWEQVSRLMTDAPVKSREKNAKPPILSGYRILQNMESSGILDVAEGSAQHILETAISERTRRLSSGHLKEAIPLREVMQHLPTGDVASAHVAVEVAKASFTHAMNDGDARKLFEESTSILADVIWENPSDPEIARLLLNLRTDFLDWEKQISAVSRVPDAVNELITHAEIAKNAVSTAHALQANARGVARSPVEDEDTEVQKVSIRPALPYFPTPAELWNAFAEPTKNQPEALQQASS